ncbi:uncharacterized protein G6M90_00g095640 [Metarhizium brunneum]|uniref:Uncharacterized protein n=1 Tax=Metarhizium brunneum TaxID=500148 RepID=A0A7D5V3Z1_9HYPO
MFSPLQGSLLTPFNHRLPLHGHGAIFELSAARKAQLLALLHRRDRISHNRHQDRNVPTKLSSQPLLIALLSSPGRRSIVHTPFAAASRVSVLVAPSFCLKHRKPTLTLLPLDNDNGILSLFSIHSTSASISSVLLLGHI